MKGLIDKILFAIVFILVVFILVVVMFVYVVALIACQWQVWVVGLLIYIAWVLT